ncbi:DUF3419 family protein [Hymenobacter sp. APR13]|uniref:DUF3419 family protein n=1 Tax=Hymenobacter sp. APR13 TaxID=1356852 RepID=UPI0004E05F92|nr:DUF3419 family protein [Hymenobacter sp. APR13]AII52786.1 hypothetical protein N008_12475 [Hymenobacter sp. APR13]
MESEFYNVALDRLRYSLVWEDSRTLYGALTIQPTDHVLVIASAGCNVLNALLKNPRHVTAIDLNPVQLQLLRLKLHVIRHHEHAVLRGLLGLAGPAAVAAAWQTVAPTLPAAEHGYWASFFESHPAGILTAGRLESYVTGFLPTLTPALQAHLRQLLGFDTVAEQAAYFEATLASSAFPALFVAYFDEANLSKGRDPRLFRYAAESGGEAFYSRLRDTLHTELMRDNFFLRFFFFGPENLPCAILPPCYQRRHHALLRQQLPKLTLVEGEAVDYLRSAAGQSISKASLSNIFEYTSPAEFQRTMQALFAGNRPLRVVYWNLLLDQGADTDSGAAPLPLATAVSERLSQQEACFYFRNVRVLDSRQICAAASSATPSFLADCA